MRYGLARFPWVHLCDQATKSNFLSLNLILIINKTLIYKSRDLLG